MSKSAKVEAGVVVNVARGNPGDYIDCPDGVAPGWTYDGAAWSAPALPADTRSDAEKAAGLTISARLFALQARPLLESKTAVAGHVLAGETIGAPLESWLAAWIVARPSATVAASLGLPSDAITDAMGLARVSEETAAAQAARVQTALADRIAAATAYARADMSIFLPLLQVTQAEVDTLFLSAAGGA